MDFIRVTLVEKLETGMKVSEIKKEKDYLLPLDAIKSVSRNHTVENGWFINICDNYTPDTNFKVAFAEAEIINAPFRILN